MFQWFFLRRAGQCVLAWVIPCTLFAPFCSTHWKLNKLKIFVELRLLDPCTSVLAKGSVPYLGWLLNLPHIQKYKKYLKKSKYMLHCVCSTSAQVFLRGAVCPILEGPLFLLNTFKSMLRFLKWCSTGSSWEHGLCTSVLAKASVPYLGRFASLATFLAPQHHLPFCPQYHTPYTHTQKHIPGTRKKTP